MEKLLKAKARSEVGSRKCASIRCDGNVPAVVYSKGENLNISLGMREVDYYLSHVGAKDLDLEIDNKILGVSIVEVQRHPVSRVVLHMDFVRR